MNAILIWEIVIIATLLVSGLLTSALLRRKLDEYDGLGEVKRRAPHRTRPADKTF